MAADKELGSELLKQDSGAGGPQAGSHKALVEEIARHERGRVRGWGWAAVILWLIVGAGLLLVRAATLFVDYFILPLWREGGGGYPNTFFITSHIALLIWPIVLCAAALCTVKFILVSRQATLRQIQAELAGISAEVQRLVAAEKR
jgi:hypothetical protein